MLRELISKFKETSIAVLPVAGIVLMLHFTIAPMPFGVLALFLSGTFLLILGMTLFQLGSEVGMTSIGNQIGSKLVELKNLKIFLITLSFSVSLLPLLNPTFRFLENRCPNRPCSAFLTWM